MIALVIALASARVDVAPARTVDAPALDGRLDDAAWATAPPFTAFVQKNPDAGGPPSEPTTVRFVYTDEALWIGIECVQERSPLVSRLTRRDREVDADRVEVDLDTRGTGRDAFHFAVNAAGVLVDGLRYDDTERNDDWDENWEAAVARTANGWSAELRIPLRVLRYAPRDGQRWGVQVRRFVSARQETDELAPIPRGEAGEVSRYGSLGPFDGLPSAASVELRPFALTSLERDPRGAYTPRFSGGGDLKWHLTPSLTLDATFNPDFAQVEADQQVLNLTTFETFYPEKRPFFLEGVDLFSAPIMMLYTRRIGIAADGQPARLWGAAKLTGTAGDDTSIGTLAAITGDTQDSTQTVFGVARVRHGLGERGHLGAFATAVGRTGDGTPRTTHDALVAGLDGRWRSADHAYVVDADVAASAIHGGPPRAQRDGIVIADGDVSPQARLSAAKESDGVVFDAEAEAYGRRFDMNDAGYLQRANLIHAYGDLGWQDSEPGDHIRESRTQIEIFGSENWKGQRLSGGYQINTHLTFLNYWSTFTELHFRPAHFDDREIGDGTALERGGWIGWEQSVASDPRRAVVGEASQSVYVLAHALQYSIDGDLTIHALPQLDVELLPSLELARGEPRYIDTLGDGTRAFGKQDALGAGLTLRTTYTFTPRATLQVYGQIFGESVAYHDFSTAPAGASEIRLDDLVAAPTSPVGDADGASAIVNASVVFRWEWRLGSLLYVVYSRAQGSDRMGAVVPWSDGLRAPSGQVFLIKASYWWG
ncbi:MAG TPA: DUF5916 domain-containing protein [Kofleriaceae bacterium]|nr:DUF5916 domain-containing protein [Kofleriaceae bacterium]